jgi:hypothetical protein
MNKRKPNILRIRCSKKTQKKFTHSWERRIPRPENPSVWQNWSLTGSQFGGKEAQLNERSEWVRREESRKMCNMDLGTIQIMKITSFLSKDHNCKSQGNY